MGEVSCIFEGASCKKVRLIKAWRNHADRCIIGERNEVFGMTVEEIKKQYPYLYETHLHTNLASACGHASGAEMAKACKEYGYAGIIVTDHNWGGNTCVDRAIPWEEWVENFFGGYEDAKAMGDEIGLSVFPGWEAGFEGTEFLIYGLGKDWMKAHPEVREATVEQLYELVRAGGGLMIHAHPYREEWYIPKVRLYPHAVDGVEIVNATHSNSKSMGHNDPEYDVRAIAYAKEHGLPTTAGSDIHSTDLFGGGMAFKRKLDSVQDFIDAIRQGEDYVVTNGEKWYDKRGNLL